MPSDKRGLNIKLLLSVRSVLAYSYCVLLATLHKALDYLIIVAIIDSV